jgi:hypothetical protein
MVLILQPLEDDGGVEAARVGEHCLADSFHDTVRLLSEGESAVVPQAIQPLPATLYQRL